jgi:plasmid maintenance system antidote protein VapI
MGFSVKEFALKTGKPEKTIHAVINGTSSLTAEMAILFEQVLDIPAQIMLDIQRRFDEFQARTQYETKKADFVEWTRQFPYADMVKRGFVEKATTIQEKTRNLLRFFNIATVDAWKELYLNQGLKVQFRTSLQHTHEAYSVSAWLRKGEIDAKKFQVMVPYDATLFEQALPECKRIMVENKPDFFQNLQKVCAKAGVKVIFTPGISKAPITGAARWIGEHPVIQLSARLKTYDGLWFSFFHEAAHILFHGKRDVFLEDVHYSDEDLQKEEEANTFARAWICPEKEYQAFAAQYDYSEYAIQRFAIQVDSHPALIEGRLCKEEKMKWSNRNFRIGLPFTDHKEE